MNERIRYYNMKPRTVWYYRKRYFGDEKLAKKDMEGQRGNGGQGKKDGERIRCKLKEV